MYKQYKVHFKRINHNINGRIYIKNGIMRTSITNNKVGLQIVL